MIKEADDTTPNNKFDVHSIDTSHSSFASKPNDVAQILAGLAP
jgi:hypothetical protein